MLVMFDLDGTLVDSSALYLTGVPLVVRAHLGRAIAVADYMDLWGRDVREWFARAVASGLKSFEEPETAALVDAMYLDFERYYVAHHSDCAAYPGVADGLKLLKDHGHRIGVVTTRPQRRAELVREFGWSWALDFVVGGDRVARRKPFPDSLEFAVDQYGCTGHEAAKAYIGDTALDIRAARASRHALLALGGLWGCREHAALLASNPDCVFANFDECVNWLTSRPFSRACDRAAQPV